MEVWAFIILLVLSTRAAPIGNPQMSKNTASTLDNFLEHVLAAQDGLEWINKAVRQRMGNERVSTREQQPDSLKEAHFQEETKSSRRSSKFKPEHRNLNHFHSKPLKKMFTDGTSRQNSPLNHDSRLPGQNKQIFVNHDARKSVKNNIFSGPLDHGDVAQVYEKYPESAEALPSEYDQIMTNNNDRSAREYESTLEEGQDTRKFNMKRRSEESSKSSDIYNPDREIIDGREGLNDAVDDQEGNDMGKNLDAREVPDDQKLQGLEAVEPIYVDDGGDSTDLEDPTDLNIKKRRRRGVVKRPGAIIDEGEDDQSENSAEEVGSALTGEGSMLIDDSNVVALGHAFTENKGIDPSSYFPNYVTSNVLENMRQQNKSLSAMPQAEISNPDQDLGGKVSSCVNKSVSTIDAGGSLNNLYAGVSGLSYDAKKEDAANFMQNLAPDNKDLTLNNPINYNFKDSFSSTIPLKSLSVDSSPLSQQNSHIDSEVSKSSIPLYPVTGGKKLETADIHNSISGNKNAVVNDFEILRTPNICRAQNTYKAVNGPMAIPSQDTNMNKWQGGMEILYAGNKDSANVGLKHSNAGLNNINVDENNSFKGELQGSNTMGDKIPTAVELQNPSTKEYRNSKIEDKDLSEVKGGGSTNVALENSKGKDGKQTENKLSLIEKPHSSDSSDEDSLKDPVDGTDTKMRQQQFGLKDSSAPSAENLRTDDKYFPETTHDSFTNKEPTNLDSVDMNDYQDKQANEDDALKDSEKSHNYSGNTDSDISDDDAPLIQGNRYLRTSNLKHASELSSSSSSSPKTVDSNEMKSEDSSVPNSSQNYSIPLRKASDKYEKQEEFKAKLRRNTTRLSTKSLLRLNRKFGIDSILNYGLYGYGNEIDSSKLKRKRDLKRISSGAKESTEEESFDIGDTDDKGKQEDKENAVDSSSTSSKSMRDKERLEASYKSSYDNDQDVLVYNKVPIDNKINHKADNSDNNIELFDQVNNINNVNDLNENELTSLKKIKKRNPRKVHVNEDLKMEGNYDKVNIAKSKTVKSNDENKFSHLSEPRNDKTTSELKKNSDDIAPEEKYLNSVVQDDNPARASSDGTKFMIEGKQDDERDTLSDKANLRERFFGITTTGSSGRDSSSRRSRDYLTNDINTRLKRDILKFKNSDRKLHGVNYNINNVKFGNQINPDNKNQLQMKDKIKMDRNKWNRHMNSQEADQIKAFSAYKNSDSMIKKVQKMIDEIEQKGHMDNDISNLFNEPHRYGRRLQSNEEDNDINSEKNNNDELSMAAHRNNNYNSQRDTSNDKAMENTIYGEDDSSLYNNLPQFRKVNDMNIEYPTKNGKDVLNKGDGNEYISPKKSRFEDGSDTEENNSFNKIESTNPKLKKVNNSPVNIGFVKSENQNNRAENIQPRKENLEGKHSGNYDLFIKNGENVNKQLKRKTTGINDKTLKGTEVGNEIREKVHLKEGRHEKIIPHFANYEAKNENNRDTFISIPDDERHVETGSKNSRQNKYFRTPSNQNDLTENEEMTKGMESIHSNIKNPEENIFPSDTRINDLSKEQNKNYEVRGNKYDVMKNIYSRHFTFGPAKQNENNMLSNGKRSLEEGTFNLKATDRMTDGQDSVISQHLKQTGNLRGREVLNGNSNEGYLRAKPQLRTQRTYSRLKVPHILSHEELFGSSNMKDEGTEDRHRNYRTTAQKSDFVDDKPGVRYVDRHGDNLYREVRDWDTRESEKDNLLKGMNNADFNSMTDELLSKTRYILNRHNALLGSNYPTLNHPNILSQPHDSSFTSGFHKRSDDSYPTLPHTHYDEHGTYGDTHSRDGLYSGLGDGKKSSSGKRCDSDRHHVYKDLKDLRDYSDESQMEETASGNLANKIVDSILNRINTTKNLKHHLGRSLYKYDCRNSPDYWIGSNAFVSEGNSYHTRIEDALKKISTILDKLISHEAQNKSCNRLQPGLHVFFQWLLGMEKGVKTNKEYPCHDNFLFHHQNKNRQFSPPKNKTSPTAEEIHREINLLTKLIEEYNHLTEIEKIKVRPVYEYLTEQLNKLQELLKKHCGKHGKESEGQNVDTENFHYNIPTENNLFVPIYPYENEPPSAHNDFQTLLPGIPSNKYSVPPSYNQPPGYPTKVDPDATDQLLIDKELSALGLTPPEENNFNFQQEALPFNEQIPINTSLQLGSNGDTLPTRSIPKGTVNFQTASNRDSEDNLRNYMRSEHDTNPKSLKYHEYMLHRP